MKRLTVSSLLAILFFINFYGVNSDTVECYACGDNGGPCSDPFLYDTDTVTKVDCEYGCGKLSSPFFSLRGCNLEPVKFGCAASGDTYACACNSDLCNGVQGQSILSATVLTACLLSRFVL